LIRSSVLKSILGVLLLVCLVQAASAASLYVAASDSSSLSQSQADLICDGINDNLEIQKAIDALPAEGGEVVLSEGTFKCTGVIRPKSHSTLKGQGDTKTFLEFTNDGRIQVKMSM